MPLRIGESAGPYVVEELVGIGGMASVYRVRHAVLGSVHALKVLRPELVQDATTRGRFLQEGQLQARFRHPGLVRVTGTVVQPGIAGIVMDFLVGENLETHLERVGPLQPATAVAWMHDALDAVGYAHGEGVVHRDLKPANLFLEQRGVRQVVRVLDFGIAMVELGARRTRGDARVGTCGYMSPEQVASPRSVDARTDVFALGAVLYEMLAGRLAFEAETDFEIMNRIVEGRYPPLLDAAPQVPEALVDVVDTALATSPDARFPSCAAFAEALTGVDVGPLPEPLPVAPARPTRPTAPSLAPTLAEPRELMPGTDVVAHLIEDFTTPEPPPPATAPPALVEAEEALPREGFETEELPPARAVPRRPPARRRRRARFPWVGALVTGTVLLGAACLVGLLAGVVPLIGEAAAWLSGPEHYRPPAGSALAGRYDLVLVPSGELWMGSPFHEDGRSADELPHRVRLTRDLWVGTTEVPQDLYREVTGSDPVATRRIAWEGRVSDQACAAWGQGDRYPVMCVDWYDAATFCNQLSVREGLEPAYSFVGDSVRWRRERNGYRLPTEAEWEYVARAGTKSTWSGTSVESEACHHGNVLGRKTLRYHSWITTRSFSCDDGVVGLAEVGRFPTNVWGIGDATGNVREWVFDAYAPYSAEAVADPATVNGELRVVRGASWASSPAASRLARRSAADPRGRSNFVGFRIVRNAQ